MWIAKVFFNGRIAVLIKRSMVAVVVSVVAVGLLMGCVPNGGVTPYVVEGPPPLQSVFADIAKNDPDPQVRMVAMKQLTNQALLAEVARTAPNVWMRLEAADRLDASSKAVAQAVYADVAKNAPDPDIRSAAIQKLAALDPDAPKEKK